MLSSNYSALVLFMFVTSGTAQTIAESKGIQPSIPGLIAHYSFDMDARDDSGNGRDGSLGGDATIGTGLIGRGSLDLRNGGGFVAIENAILNRLPECSMSFWVNFESLNTGDDCCLAIFAEDDFFETSLHTNVFEGSSIEWALGGNEVNARTAAPEEGPPTGWVHYAWTYNRGARDVFVNGELVVDSDIDPNAIECGNNTSSTIGAWNQDGVGTYSRFLSAQIDDVRFYDRMLSGDEVVALSQTAATNALQGAWVNQNTLGQGLLFDPLRAVGSVFGAWFTYDEASSKLGSSDNRWFTVLLVPQGPELNARIIESSAGVFDSPEPTTATEVGDVNIRLNNCRSAQFNYSFDSGPSGSFAIEPLGDLIGAPGATCE